MYFCGTCNVSHADVSHREIQIKTHYDDRNIHVPTWHGTEVGEQMGGGTGENRDKEEEEDGTLREENKE